MKHSIEKLPKWAQNEIFKRDLQIRELSQRVETMERINRLMDTHKWTTIPPVSEDMRLHRLYKDSATCVMSLGKGDMLFIGRKRRQDATGEIKTEGRR